MFAFRSPVTWMFACRTPMIWMFAFRTPVIYFSVEHQWSELFICRTPCSDLNVYCVGHQPLNFSGQNISSLNHSCAEHQQCEPFLSRTPTIWTVPEQNTSNMNRSCAEYQQYEPSLCRTPAVWTVPVQNTSSLNCWRVLSDDPTLSKQCVSCSTC